MEESITLQLPTPESAMALAGEAETNLKLLSRQTGAKLQLRSQELHIGGTPKQVALCQEILHLLAELWQAGKPVSEVDILTVRHALNTHRQAEYQALQEDVLARTRRGDLLRAKTFRQRQYVQSIRKHTLTFGIGPAGTGKTFLAAVLGVQALLANEYERLVLTRPAVEAGEKLGFLPGDLQQKVNPYLRPLYDALHDLIEPERIAALMERGTIEVAPLAYMRGRTLNNAFVILDEAQNTTPAQMKMMLTRIGLRSRLVVTGDVTQTDLPLHQTSGLILAEKILANIEGIAFCYLSKGDIVRHPLVEKIVDAYERYEATGQ
ncbi:AAA family ATPase [Synechococcales cyanobacterium C]|uniref:PhoH-like protein n=1 Tax=Petrachloros mirabilis ULC683 TaxID=2781853 RepID=A0A8K2A0N8_9CYAN|nr:PhoH family protein [Petrachloros mirabilis]NCJ07421.1 AAA family ATPase [Petrachloros mirabilis ULC683]